jgi:hypothetical protein
MDSGPVRGDGVTCGWRPLGAEQLEVGTRPVTWLGCGLQETEIQYVTFCVVHGGGRSLPFSARRQMQYRPPRKVRPLVRFSQRPAKRGLWLLDDRLKTRDSSL